MIELGVPPEDLATRCERVPSPRRELFHANQYYGIDLWLKLEAGLPPTVPLKVMIPHGLAFNPASLLEEEVQSRLPLAAVYPRFRLPTYRSATSMYVVPAAAPYLYASRALETASEDTRPRREGTLVFPSHSTALHTVDVDYEHLARDVGQLGAEYRPVTVCIYWRDYELGRHRYFLDRGLRVVSCGHRNRSDFFACLWALLKRHRYACGDGFGSHMFYAVTSGCEYFFLDPDRWIERAPVLNRVNRPPLPSWVPQHAEHEAREMLEAAVGAYGIERPDPRKRSDQLSIANYYLSREHLLSGEELRELLDLARRLDRTPFVSQPGAGRRWVVPPVLTRSLVRAWRSAHRSVTSVFRRSVSVIRRAWRLIR